MADDVKIELALPPCFHSYKSFFEVEIGMTKDVIEACVSCGYARHCCYVDGKLCIDYPRYPPIAAPEKAA